MPSSIRRSPWRVDVSSSEGTDGAPSVEDKVGNFGGVLTCLSLDQITSLVSFVVNVENLSRSKHIYLKSLANHAPNGTPKILEKEGFNQSEKCLDDAFQKLLTH